MPSVPVMTCPHCRREMEYHVTLEVMDPPVGRIDTGYCASCARLFERVRESGTYYDSTSWPPVCRQCRQPVSFARIEAGGSEVVALFDCRNHPREQWRWRRADDRWARIEHEG